MIAVEQIPQRPPAELLSRRRLRIFAGLLELWHGREVLVTLAERDLRVRYKQAFFGVAWALVQPLSLVLVFAVLFRHVAHINTHGASYACFSMLGLLPWTFFSEAVSTGGLSLLNNNTLISKVYCPRELFPLAGVAVAAADTCVATLALIVIFAVQGQVPTSTTPWALLALLVQVVVTVAATVFFSAVVVYVRDIRHLLPLLLQFGVFATPVAYALSAVPHSWRALYVGLNPLAVVIDTYRRAILFGQPPDWGMFAIGAGSATGMLLIAMVVFRRVEAGIADYI